MKHLAYISGLLLLLLCSCSDDIQSDTSNADVPDGTPIEIMAAAEFPEMNLGPSSRAMVDQPTAELLNSLKVNILVFDAAGVMLQFIPPTDISIESIDEATSTVHFRVRNIYSSTQPRRLHFVVTSVPDIREIEGGENITAMANETTVMPALMTSGDTDVYWGLSEPEKITNDMTLEMRVIRNFVKIDVKSSASEAKFKLLGYTVVNRPSKGTVAPYIYNDHTFASFINPDNTLKSYDEIVSQDYHGINPAGSEASMTHTTEEEVTASLADSEALIAAGKKSPYYLYERSQSGIASIGSDAIVTYVIVKGTYEGTTYYYKIDIGGNNETTKKFEFYDLLRNFQYTIDITDVHGPGAGTLVDAMNGVTYNNISASVITHDLFAISYYDEQIVVSDTRVIFTEKTTDFQLRFRYTVPAGLDYEFNKADLKVYDLNDESKEYNLNDHLGQEVDLGGEVIESARLEAGEGGWYILNITTKDIPADARRLEQELRVYYSGGTVNLGRSVTLMLRQPWLLSNVESTTPTTAMQSEFSVKFTLPSGLVSSQFPLTLTFESDKQNIYAKKGTDLHVATGKSGFKGATTDNIILYEWSMPYSDYRHADGSEGGEYTAVFLTNTTSTEDASYPTTGIDNADNSNSTSTTADDRDSNNGTNKFCIRIANKGQKCIEPYYVNITR